MRSDLVRLKDMLDASLRIAEFASDMNLESFNKDLKTQSAVQHQIMVMGEAASKVSRTFKTQHPGIPWADITQLRNFYIHAYHQVDTVRLWRTLHGMVADVERKIAPLISADGSNTGDGE
jgi:uncharacterized protein with HEPN domain